MASRGEWQGNNYTFNPKINLKDLDKSGIGIEKSGNLTSYKQAGLLFNNKDFITDYPYARKDVVESLKIVRQEIKQLYGDKADFKLTGGFSGEHLSVEHKIFGTAVDTVPVNITYDQLRTVLKKHGFNYIVHDVGKGVHAHAVYKGDYAQYLKDQSTIKSSTKTLQGGVEYNDYRSNSNQNKTQNSNKIVPSQPNTPTGKAAPISHSQNSEIIKELLKSGEGFDILGDAAQEWFDDRHSGTVLYGSAVINEKFSGENFYDPVTKMVNYDQTQRVLTGSVNANQEVEPDFLKAISSRSFGREEPFTTPNLESIKNVLYKGVNFGVQKIKGYLQHSIRELVYGPKGSKFVEKVESIRNYTRLAMTFAKSFSQNKWEASVELIQILASSEWQFSTTMRYA